MNTTEKTDFSLTDAAKNALAQHFGDDRPPCLRVFLSFLSDSGPRLELSLDAPAAEDAAFTIDGWNFVVNRQLWLQAAPLTVDSDDAGFRIHSSLDFSQAGGSCGGDCHSH